MKRFFVILTIVALIVVGLTACVRSKSSGGAKPTKTPAGKVTPAGTIDVMSQLQLFVTQTAMAKIAQGTPLATPVPVKEGTALPTETKAEEGPTAVPVLTPTAVMVKIPTATPGLPRTYTIQGGEFPYCIARRFNVNPGELLNLNGLGTNTTLRAGYTLKIPQTGQPFPGKRALIDHPDTYTVSGNETIFEIACKYGDVDPYNIALANGLKAPYKLKAGQTLQIP